MAFGVIYLLIDGTNDEEYVGQTRRSVKVRFNEHLHGTSYIGKSIRAHGAENFVIAILKECANQQELDYWEKHFILSRGTKYPNGYNFTDGGSTYTDFVSKSPAKTSASRTEENFSLTKRSKTFYKNLLAEILARKIYRTLRLQRLWLYSVAPVIITLLVNRQRRHYPIELLTKKRSGGQHMKEDFSAELRCIGARIVGFRKLRNMTQAELADKLDINKNYLSQIENASGNKTVSLPMLIKISRALDVELALLTDIDGVYKSDLKNFWSDMKETFEGIKQLNDDMDKMIDQFERADKIFSSSGNSSVKK
ncbi:MAG: helix-turn-helix domain-containing protein [Selenomonadaceae bacterium]|nr:helix-turn-helix domain-containing protein [Selenomonadaceae bacterium]